VKEFDAKALSTIEQTKYFYLRAGDVHRFTPVWVVIVDRRVLVRPWNDEPRGWYRAFVELRYGAVKLGARTVSVTAKRVRSPKLLQAMDAAYAAKYTTVANATYVRGFATHERRPKALELSPRTTKRK
jgi:hypothetical protein